ncbi:MAG: Chemotaxis protein methyltransferase CheR [Cyanobacteria bacterium RYN_339]|nr:Chemotaxis protein methyltransferase CheR [Cyanobacteria bacterium RYN_339]
MVDDRPENLVALSAVLGDLGLHLVQAHSGEEALKAVLTQDVALILMDVQMPGLDGFETVSLIKRRAHCKHIPIIFVTAASVSDTAVHKGYAVGAVDYILKPYEPDILRAKVGVFVDLYLQQEQIAQQARKLAEQEHFFAQLLDNLAVAVVYVEHGRTYRLVNKAAARRRGTTPDRLISQPFDDAEAIPYVDEVMRTGRPSTAYTVSTAASYWDHAFYPVADDGKVSGVLLLSLDVTPRVEAEREQEQLRTLKQLDRLKNEFLSAVSHELRTPLTSIMGYAEFLDDQIGGALTPEQHQFVRRILAGGMRLKTLVDDLLDFAHVEAGTLELECEPFDLAAIAADVVDRMAAQADQSGVILEAKVAQPVTGAWDRRRVDQVLVNLVDNALKFTPKGGTITVEVSQAMNEALVEIRDTGCGIHPEHLPHIFEKFYQADPSLTRLHGGAGLGLSLCKAFVEAHGGHIGVLSDAGAGSRFWFTLPKGP